MAKKTAKKTTKNKPAATKAKKKASPKKAECVEIELEGVEAEAYELAHSSDKVCEELEVAVSEAMSQIVRKVFKQNKISLTIPQSQKVAMFLFGN